MLHGMRSTVVVCTRERVRVSISVRCNQLVRTQSILRLKTACANMGSPQHVCRAMSSRKTLLAPVPWSRDDREAWPRPVRLSVPIARDKLRRANARVALTSRNHTALIEVVAARLMAIVHPGALN